MVCAHPSYSSSVLAWFGVQLSHNINPMEGNDNSDYIWQISFAFKSEKCIHSNLGTWQHKDSSICSSQFLTAFISHTSRIGFCILRNYELNYILFACW